MVEALIWLVVVVIILSLLIWLIDYLPVPSPLNRFAKIGVVVLGTIAVIYVLLKATGTPIPT